MVYLIGGASCSGKTTIAKEIMENKKINYLSLDNLKMGLVRTGLSKVLNFNIDDNDQLIKKNIWPIVKEIIKTVIENCQDLVIEGVYIDEDDLNNFSIEYSKFIKSVFIVFSEKYIKNNYNTIIKYLSISENKDYDESYMTITNFIKMHKKEKELCEKNKIKYIEINDNYIDEINEIYNILF